MTRNCIIVEDEKLAREKIALYLSNLPEMELKGEYATAHSFLEDWKQGEDLLLFLDINLPDLNGLELAAMMKQNNQVIFTTAYSEYALNGFELDAVDYLLKPINYPRFLKACEKLRKHQHLKTIEKEESNLAFSDLVYVKSGKTVHKLFWKDVLYLEKDDNYVIYHLADQKILSRQTLGKLEYAFPNYICRIHKSFAVSLLHIEQSRREVVMIGGRELPVGRKFRKLFVDALAVRKFE